MNSHQTKETYNRDIKAHGGYVYTTLNQYSTRVATQKQTDEIHKLIKKYFTKNISILDIGCGDGTYTLQLKHAFPEAKITGFDISNQAIKQAKKKSKTIPFFIGTIYKISGSYDLGILRGVLHHVEEPQKAIYEVSRATRSVLVLEPNGFNPILKIIEKISPYHREHGEKSYWPPTLNRWFLEHNYTQVSQKYFSIIPYFCPEWLVKMLKPIEPIIEKMPIIRNILCGGILTLYRK